MRQNLCQTGVKQRHADGEDSHPIVMIWVEQMISSREKYERINREQSEIFEGFKKTERIARQSPEVFECHFLTFEEPSAQVREEEDQEHSGLKEHHRAEFPRMIIVRIPKPEQEVRSREGQRGETPPAPQESEHADVERGNVTEQRTVLIAIRAQK